MFGHRMFDWIDQVRGGENDAEGVEESGDEKF
jgi:hypothetical protein